MKPDTKLINKSDIKKAVNLKGPAGSLAASCAMSLMGLNRINRLYPEFGEFHGREFTKAAMRTFRISTDILHEELEYIPREGPFIIVSNHPFGGWDGIVLYNTVAAIRPDFKIITNFILSCIPNLKDSFLAVNPFSDNKGLKSSFSGIKAAMDVLDKGGCVGIFPAGEVSTYYKGRKYPADKEWTGAIMKLIRNSGVPVVPVYFDGTNSRWFHFVGKIHPVLRTVNLPNELLKRSGKTVTMRIGRPFPASEIQKYKDIKELGRVLRNRVYAMEANIHKQLQTSTAGTPNEPLIQPVDSRELAKEMDALTPLFEVHRYRCYLADTEQIPAMMTGGGRSHSGRWEKAPAQASTPTSTTATTSTSYSGTRTAGNWPGHTGWASAGRYMRDTESKGSTPIPSSSTPKSSPKNSECIELGRSFLSVEYKKEALPLMLLIKGLLFTVIRYSHCKYLFGPASITSWLPPFYRSLIIYGLSLCTHDSPKGLVTPRTPFKYDFMRVDPALLLKGKTGNVDSLDKCIQRLSDGRYRIPTLLKKYVKLGADILAYNVDKEFNYCVDGMIFLDIDKVPRSEVVLLTKGSDNPETLLERFKH